MNLALRAAIAALLVLVVPAGAAAQMYRWTDDQGQVFYTQGLDSVPERYRAGARIVGSLESPGTPIAPPQSRAEAPAATTRIRFTPGHPIMVTALINGAGSAELMLDTGAAVTVINPRVLAALGVGMGAAQRSTLQGVTGRADTLAVTLESIEVAGTRVGPLKIVSHDVAFGQGDGLLGRDFLDHFTVNIDNRAGLVTLSPR